MTIGSAIVVVMILYLLDKHGRLRLAAGIVAVLAIIALLSIFGQQQYRKWQNARYERHHAEMKVSLIKKYHGAVLAPQVQWDDETKSTAVKSVPLDELDKKTPPVKTAGGTVEFSEADIEKVYLDDICKEPQWKELDDWERNAVIEAVMPKINAFERLQFLDKCH
jgi:hypothetical protein